MPEPNISSVTEPIIPSVVPPQSGVRTYSEADYRAMATQQYLAGIAHVARALGVELDEENTPKKQIAQIADAVKEARTAAETTAAETAKGEAQLAHRGIEDQLAALKAGVPADKVERVVKYTRAGMDKDDKFADALKVTLEDLGIKAAEPADTKKKDDQPSTTKPQLIASQNNEPPPPAKRWKEMGPREQVEFYRKDRAAAVALAKADDIDLES